MRVLTGVGHELLRYGLIQLIKDVHLIESMVMTQTVEELVHALKKYQFDFIVIDDRLIKAGGLTNILSLLENQPSKKVFMFSHPVRELEKLIDDNIVDGLFYEHAPLNDLMVFFQKVIQGERAILRMYGDKENVEIIPNDLSKREEEIFNMKVRGYSVVDTARLLNISPKTVENHRRNIRKKLNIRKNHEWFEWGKRLGVI
ncbi:hypothetical protein CR194_00590 [Salipaludibacillus keqinensis]|uniref:HTH luxR-type domain-containing protein n=1 Tax=Salipaludibacillus keqinensis TaxID=2045207 RepID=A0A323TMY1_9BACI|nr:response regulator transcription factor [Salipaludibacillus keqinensis]PYZ94073.1 hypothetical protein CR194_00590 [Salipaludibacillus keqinensis]